MHIKSCHMCVGLSLVINIQQDQYVSESGNTAGIIVLVLPQNLMPFPEDHGILVSPGYETEVSVSMVCTVSSVDETYGPVITVLGVTMLIRSSIFVSP